MERINLKPGLTPTPPWSDPDSSPWSDPDSSPDSSRDPDSSRARGILQDVGNVLAIAFAPDGALASANQAGEVKLWDPSTGVLVRTIRVESEQLRCVAFTPDSREVVAAGMGKVIRVWDVATGQELLALEGHKAQVNALSFSPDGSILASCSHEGAVKLWRAESMPPVAAMDR